jgi:hypothetical protein
MRRGTIQEARRRLIVRVTHHHDERQIRPDFKDLAQVRCFPKSKELAGFRT